MSTPEGTNQRAPAHDASPIEAPPGFGRSSIEPPRSQPEATAINSQPSPHVGSISPTLGPRREFAASVHSYVRENIQFADQKAIFFFTGSTALLAFLYKAGTSSKWMKPFLDWNPIDTAGFVAMVCLAIGAALSLLVVMPRLPGSRRGFIFWEAVADYESARHYADELAQATAASLTQSVAEHCHELSKVCRAKYRLLSYSIRICGVGLLAAIVVFLFGTNLPP